jgi:hypothetical protein
MKKINSIMNKWTNQFEASKSVKIFKRIHTIRKKRAYNDNKQLFILDKKEARIIL